MRGCVFWALATCLRHAQKLLARFAAKGNPLRRLRNITRTALFMRLAKNRRYETKGKDLIVGISFGDIFPIEKTTKPAS